MVADNLQLAMDFRKGYFFVKKVLNALCPLTVLSVLEVLNVLGVLTVLDHHDQSCIPVDWVAEEGKSFEL